MASFLLMYVIVQLIRFFALAIFETKTTEILMAFNSFVVYWLDAHKDSTERENCESFEANLSLCTCNKSDITMLWLLTIAIL